MSARHLVSTVSLFVCLLAGGAASAATLSGQAFCGSAGMDGAQLELILDATQQSAGVVTTASDGSYSIDVPVGIYDIAVTPPAGSGCSAEVVQNKEIPGNLTYQIVLFLPGPQTVQVTGTVTVNGAPVPNAYVSFSAPGSNASAATDADGRYTVSLTTGVYRVNYEIYGEQGSTVPGYVQCRRFDLPINAAAVIDLELPVVTVGGTVTGDQSGDPLAALSVSANSYRELADGYCNGYGDGTTNAAGVYGPIYLLGGGELSVSTPSVSGSLDAASATVNAPPTGSVTVDLQPHELVSVTVSGTVTGHDGEPLPDVYVSYSRSGQNFSVTTDEDGFYTLNPTPGTYRVNVEIYASSATFPSYVQCRRFDVVIDGDGATIDFALPTVALTGTVSGQPSGAPVPGMSVSISSYLELSDGYCNGYADGTTIADGSYGPIYVLAAAETSVSTPSVSGSYDAASVTVVAPASGGFVADLTPTELQTFEVVGSVKVGGVPLPNAYVSWSRSGQNFSTTTDENGMYNVSATPGSYRINVEFYGEAGSGLPSYMQCRQFDVVVDGPLTVVLDIPSARVDGTVSSSTAIPIAGVNVDTSSYAELTDGYCNAYDSRSSDSDGHYTLSVLLGDTSFQFTPPSGSGYVNASVNSVVTGDFEQQVVLQLPDIVPPTITAGPFVIHNSDTSVSIQWATNELTDAKLDYEVGTEVTGAALTVTSATLSTNHIVTLSGLLPETEYAFRVTSKDSGNNSVQSDVGTFVTIPTPGDIDPPAFLSGPTVTFLAPTSAVVVWKTNEPADSVTTFGLAGATRDRTVTSGAFVLDHSAALTGLSPETSYDVVVASTDPDGNGPTASGVLTFTTPAAADTTPPEISGLRTECVTESKMAVCWETSEPATSNLSVKNTGSGATANLSQSGYVTTRCMAVTGLAADTEYAVNVSSADGGFNSASAGPLVQRTAASADDGAPVVSGFVATYLSATSARIVWETDVASSTFVRYGASEDALTGTAGDLAGSTTHHEVVLTGLPAGGLTFVKASSSDPCGREGVAGPTLVVDVDECGDDALNDCDANATCENTVGSYVCTCDDGWDGDGTSCADVDECA
ncbi:MAG: carboxypeptidase regulatory-like domain-containing protein, partial [Myxococcales bacterium]|nr:carboxypeptidase regulatory-like domain-containing protein [Myxococcales bacterium]